MTTRISSEDVVTLPVPEDSLQAIQEEVRAEIAAQGDGGRALGVEQEFPVYRAAARGVLELLKQQLPTSPAAEVLEKMQQTAADAAKSDRAVDIFTVADAEERREDFRHREEGVDIPTDDERLVSLINAVGMTAHSIAAVELGHLSADSAGIERAEKELNRPNASMEIGSITQHTLQSLLDEMKAPAHEQKAA